MRLVKPEEMIEKSIILRFIIFNQHKISSGIWSFRIRKKGKMREKDRGNIKEGNRKLTNFIQETLTYIPTTMTAQVVTIGHAVTVTAVHQDNVIQIITAVWYFAIRILAVTGAMDFIVDVSIAFLAVVRWIASKTIIVAAVNAFHAVRDANFATIRAMVPV